MVLDPVNRASRWRYDENAPKNYDDAALWCGGYWTQHGVNHGKCGLCGDSYSDIRPRKHEIGGSFGQGVITKTYKTNAIITIGVQITVNHKGYFWFDLCNFDLLDGAAKIMEEEECFNEKLLTVNGEEYWYLTSSEAKLYEVHLKLQNTTCNHCILRWTYVAGNNWGTCENGTQALGCGPQEHFRTCSDISIRNTKADQKLGI
uniref:CSON009774 protein n=1 Tax=Culicoides sonorensis TaxID=179676 RepID=A0A336KRD7_CULSO